MCNHLVCPGSHDTCKYLLFPPVSEFFPSHQFCSYPIVKHNTHRRDTALLLIFYTAVSHFYWWPHSSHDCMYELVCGNDRRVASCKLESFASERRAGFSPLCFYIRNFIFYNSEEKSRALSRP